MSHFVRPSVRLEELMASSGMTVGELSALCGLSYERTRRLLRSGADPRLSEAFRIARLVESSVGELFVVSHPSSSPAAAAPRPRATRR